MMKRFLALALCLVSLVFGFSIEAGAAQTETVEIIPLEDGCYLEVTTTSVETRAVHVKTGTKSYTSYNASGEKLWMAEVSGIFQYDGWGAACTDASCKVTVYNRYWSVDSKSATFDGNTARATVVMDRVILGVTGETLTYHLEVSCDKDGNIY